MSQIPQIKLNDGNTIPQIGFGVWRITPGQESIKAIKYALKTGYRHIDTAQFYGNEKAVGEAIRESGIPRDEIFVTTKIAISNFGYDQALASIDDSLDKFGYDNFDLIILHFPVEKLRIETYQALEQALKDGKTKSIGVSNFTIEQLSELTEATEVVPVVNQVEFSPFLFQKELLEHCHNNDIQIVGYAPLTKGKKLNNPLLVELGKKYGKTPAQIILRWAIEHKVITIPKTVNPERMQENFNLFDFSISAEDMQLLDGINENYRTSWNPEDQKQVWAFSKDIVRKLIGKAR